MPLFTSIYILIILIDGMSSKKEVVKEETITTS
jgi:hypothetical protein